MFLEFFFENFEILKINITEAPKPYFDLCLPLGKANRFVEKNGDLRAITVQIVPMMWHVIFNILTIFDLLLSAFGEGFIVQDWYQICTFEISKYYELRYRYSTNGNDFLAEIDPSRSLFSDILGSNYCSIYLSPYSTGNEGYLLNGFN